MREKLLQELQELYKDPLTTDAIKSDAWNIRGIEGYYFRSIVKGIKTNDKPFEEDEIQGCLLALKQAIKNDQVKRQEYYSKAS